MEENADNFWRYTRFYTLHMCNIIVNNGGLAMEKLKNIHPGEILEKEFMKPLRISKYKLSRGIDVTPIEISEIIKGKRNISTLMAIKLSKYLGTSYQFWLNLQIGYDVEEIMLLKKKDIDCIKKYSE
jgi:addiction module HigA family antidote